MGHANINLILESMRADCVPAGSLDRWTVSKRDITQKQSAATLRLERKSRGQFIPPGHYTLLHCTTFGPLYQSPGDVVMNDFPAELKKHLEFILLARGHVLVGGLGLGCVVRGLLTHGRVDHVDVIERSKEVIELCGESVRDDRVTIHNRDAIHGFVKGGPWDYAWWDLWSDPEKSEPHLQVIHMELVARFQDRVKNLQGCWAMPRKHRRSLRKHGIIL